MSFGEIYWHLSPDIHSKNAGILHTLRIDCAIYTHNKNNTKVVRDLIELL